MWLWPFWSAIRWLCPNSNQVCQIWLLVSSNQASKDKDRANAVWIRPYCVYYIHHNDYLTFMSVDCPPSHRRNPPVGTYKYNLTIVTLLCSLRWVLLGALPSHSVKCSISLVLTCYFNNNKKNLVPNLIWFSKTLQRTDHFSSLSVTCPGMNVQDVESD